MLAVAIWFGGAFAATPTDDWVPYTDGRFGGCYRTEAGKLYNCTRKPRQIDETITAPEDGEEEPPPAADDEVEATRQQLRAVQRELADLKRRQAEDDARRAHEQRAQAAAEAAEREAQAAEQRDIDAAMAAYNAIEGAKDSENLRLLQEKTEKCRASLQAKGFRVVGPGACQSQDGVYLNCPEC